MDRGALKGVKMPTRRKKIERKPIKTEPSWKKELEGDYLKLGYEKCYEKHSPVSYQQWRFLGTLLRKHRTKYRKVGKQFIPLN
jgi:hypothetical protein